MSEFISLILACGAGLFLGGLYFAGLWWTVRRCLSTPYPALWLLGSGILRMALALSGFYLVGGGDWQKLVACLAGFLVARRMMTRWFGLAMANNSTAPLLQEVNHAT